MPDAELVSVSAADLRRLNLLCAGATRGLANIYHILTSDVCEDRIALGSATSAAWAVAQQSGAVLNALLALVTKLESVEADETYRSVWGDHFKKSGQYQGPNWDAELARAQQIVAPMRPKTNEPISGG